MTPADLSAAVLAAVSQSLAEGEFTGTAPAEVVIERPRNPEHGDYTTNVAMRLAKPAGKPAREVAAAIAARLAAVDAITKVDVAGPGFLNITLAPDALGQVARTIVEAGPSFGTGDALAGQNLNLEFVSANPTGPVHIGGARWAAVGDALARLVQANGARVTREYYVNDAGSQIERFARTLREVANGRPVPEDGYAGSYIDDIAAAVLAQNPGLLDLSDDQQLEVFKRDGVDQMLAEIKSSLADFGVVFDVYFRESDLHARNELDLALKRLRDQGHVFAADGATWLRTTDYGDDRDRVLVRSNGEWTYFAADCAYYLDKRERGFDKVVIMLAADHHGYINRLRAMATCFGDNPGETLDVFIGQLVNLVKDGEPMRMSKRAGNVIVLADLVDAIGADAARYALVRYSVEQGIDIDLDLWARRGNDNPVYYVQYAHARLASLQTHAAELGIVRSAEPDLGLLTHDREVDLLGALGEFPRVVASAAELRAPHRVAHYLESLAGTYHRFYDACRVLPMGDEPATELTHARLWLCEATRIVLANGLALLGVTAPERM
ncbi:MAG: arginyl-tRNA synthetase [Pseudonocardiales bacterium]|nr:arginyl-tRNA synthetase [Pseudonocardiales bacterium]MDT4964563.1 arginyl-tRNA synthetase [Pseudonocardiales bacterium]